jgi:pimeloyl-ACP methyl ester carboxylesterase
VPDPSATGNTAPPNELHIDTPQGSIFVRQVPGEDPPVVLMHGFPDDQRIYNRLLPHLSPRRAVAFDFLGYGRSDRSDAVGFTPEEHGSQIAAVLDALGISSAVLVGHDASGPDAVFYTVSNPERVAHLVLLNTIFGHQNSLTMPEMTRLFAEPELTSLADDMISDAAQRLWLLQRWGVQWELDAADPDGIALQSILPQFFGDGTQPDALTAIRHWTSGLFESLDKQDAVIATGTLRQLKVPVSIIFGERDRYMTPSLATEIAQLFKAPSLHLLNDAGHYPQHDQPEVVAKLLEQPS